MGGGGGGPPQPQLASQSSPPPPSQVVTFLTTSSKLEFRHETLMFTLIVLNHTSKTRLSPSYHRMWLTLLEKQSLDFGLRVGIKEIE